MQWIQAFFSALLAVWLEAAPWLLVGLMVAGLIHVFVPTQRMARWLGGVGLWPSLKAAVLGTPLPLCSCSVLPAALAIRKQGASKPSTVSFLVATPENGADSIALTWALLGPWFAITRPIAAILSAVAAGGLTAWWTQAEQNTQALVEKPSDSACTSCCCSEGTESKATTPAKPEATKPTEPPAPFGHRLIQALRFGFGTMLADMAKWLIIGLLLAALINTLIDPGTLAKYGSGPLAYAIMLVVGVPMYICATASTPVAASLLLAGVSPGAVMIFLLAGPATNLGSIAIIRQSLGNRALLAYLTGVILVALLSAVVIDQTGYLLTNTATQAGHVHEHTGPLTIAAGVVLAIIMLRFPAQAALRRLRHQPSTANACCGSPTPSSPS